MSVLLQEAIEAVEKINGLGEGMCATVSYEPLSGSISIEHSGSLIWDSEDDEREQVGECAKCRGSGIEGELETHPPQPIVCTTCGGTGKDDPREPLFLYLVCELRRRAQKMLNVLTGEY